jgi:hypothetical protein
MPDKMKGSCNCQCRADLNMPFNQLIYKRELPFIINLKSQEQAGKRGKYKKKGKKTIPDFPVKLTGVKSGTVKTEAEQVQNSGNSYGANDLIHGYFFFSSSTNPS